MHTFLQQARVAQSATRLSGRRLCQRAGLSRATYQRWCHRNRCGQPLLQRPGPPKTGPLPLAEVRAQIQQLVAGPHRTRGTGALCQQYRDGLSRRQLAALVREHRRQQREARRSQLLHLTWFTVQTAWALDATEWGTDQPGVKLQVLAARDLASNYGLGLQAQRQLCGGLVAEYLAQLIHRHGPPLFLKRDNGGVLHTPDVEQVLAAAAVLPLDSPVHYPGYNGGMEKHIGDLKHAFPYALPGLAPASGPSAQILLEALRHEANTQPREALAGDTPAEMFFTGPHLHVARPTRAAIFQSLQCATRRILSHMRTPDHRCLAAAWRQAAQSWLRRQALISVSTNPNPQPNIN